MTSATYVPITSVTLSTSASEVVVSALPQIYRDLIIVMSAKHSFAGSLGVRDDGLQFNSDSGSNYPQVWMQGNGSSTSSSSATGVSIALLYGMASADFMPSVIQVMDYSASDKQKAVLYRAGMGNDSNYGSYALAGRWANTAAITSLRIKPSGSYTLLSGTTLSVYGVSA